MSNGLIVKSAGLLVKTFNFSKALQPNLIHHFRNFCENTDMSKNALVFLAPGAEEMEFVIAADVLRRGGIEVTVASVDDEEVQPVKCSRGINIVPDTTVKKVVASGDVFDVLVLPGGLGGSVALAHSSDVGKLLKEQEKAKRLIAAICAAPTALKAHSIGAGRSVTSYPSMEKEMTEGEIYKYKTDDVVVDENFITSRGPGTAFNFALTIVDKLVSNDKAKEVARAMLLSY